MSTSAESGDPGDGVRLDAVAYGQASINQAGRDQHFHYGDGVRRVPAAGAADGECPYPGLASFSAEQASWFFGRDRVVADLLGRLNECLKSGGLVMLVAASGAGKSSLLRAGVLPGIAGGGLTPAASRHWPRVVFTPGVHPMRQAAAGLVACLDAGDTDLPADPSIADLDSLLTRVAAGADGQRGSGARVVIVVDQFEELFRLCDGEEERGAFISWLCQGRRPDGVGVLVVCAVRADFYPDCARYPQLRQALQDNQIIVGAMTAEELRQAITFPARAAGLDIEAGLTELLVADLRVSFPAARSSGPAADDGAGRLPLLAHALRATWQRRHGSMLTVDGYRVTGGIEHAIADSAERVFAHLDSVSQREARALFLRLVKIGVTSSEDVRRSVPSPGLGNNGDGAATAVIDAYTASRLLTRSRDAVQITHEALLRAWPRLAGWLDDDRAGHLIRQRLEDDAADWDRAGRDPSRLYRGSRTETAAAWAAGHRADLTATASRFLAASQRLSRRTRIIRRSGIAVLAVLALVTTVTSLVALQQRSVAVSQRNLATQQRDLAIYNQVQDEALQASASNPSLAAQLTLAAYRLHPTQDLAAQLVSSENTPLSTPLSTGSDSPIQSMALSPDGRTLASVNLAGAVQLSDIASSTHPRPLGLLGDSNNSISALAFSPDSQLLATAGFDSDSGDGAIWVWDVKDPARAQEVGGPLVPDGPPINSGTSNPVNAIAFSPNSQILASAESNANATESIIQLWDMSNPRSPQRLGQYVTRDGVESLAFSPGGQTLVVEGFTVSNSSTTVQLLNVSDAARPLLLKKLFYGSGSSPDTTALSSDGILATGDSKGNIRLWGGDTAHLRALSGSMADSTKSLIVLLAFSPDGRTLASVDASGTVQLWNITHPAQPRPLIQPFSIDGIDSLTFSRDGQTLVSGEENGTIQLWGIPRTILNGSAMGNFYAEEFSADGHILASVDSGGLVQFWGLANPVSPEPIGHFSASRSQRIESVAFSPEGHALAAVQAGGHAESVQLWSITNPAHPKALGRLSMDNGIRSPISLAFSPNGRTLAIGSNSIQLWDISDLAHPRPGTIIRSENQVSIAAIAFSPNGRILASVDYSGNFQLWDAIRPSSIQAALGNINISPGGNISPELLYSADGKSLILLNGDGKAEIWNVTLPVDPVRLSQLPTSTTGPVSSIALSPNGFLATTGSDGRTQLWTITNLAHPKLFGHPITATGSTGLIAFGTSNMMASENSNGLIFLWNLNVTDAINRICTAASDNLNSQNWSQYVPQLPYRTLCRQ